MISVYDNERKLTGILSYKKALVFIANYKNKILNCKIRKFTGVRTIGRAICEDNQKFYFKLNIIEGKAKIIFVKDRKINFVIENKFDGEIETNLEKGIYKLRIVGECADLDLSIKKI